MPAADGAPPTEQQPAERFLAGTRVLLAVGSSKPISAVRAGDRVANSQPGNAGLESHAMDQVINDAHNIAAKLDDNVYFHCASESGHAE